MSIANLLLTFQKPTVPIFKVGDGKKLLGELFFFDCLEEEERINCLPNVNNKLAINMAPYPSKLRHQQHCESHIHS